MKRYIVIASLLMMVGCGMVAMEPQERQRTRDPQRGRTQSQQGEMLRIRGRGNTVTYLNPATGKSTTYDIVENRKEQKRSHRSRKQRREKLPAVPEEEGRSTQEEEIIDPKTLSYDSSI